MALDTLTKMFYNKDIFGISIEKLGSLLSSMSFDNLGNDIKNKGIIHQRLIGEHKNRIDYIIKKHGFEERLLKKYLKTISGTMVLEAYCKNNGYEDEFNKLYNKFKQGIRKGLLDKEYWHYEENYLNKSQAKFIPVQNTGEE